MNASGDCYANQVIGRIPAGDGIKGQHHKGHSQGLLQGAEAENIKPQAIPHQKRKPGRRRVAEHQIGQNTMDHNCGKKQNDLIISIGQNMEQFQKIMKAEVFSVAPQDGVKPACRSHDVKGCLIFDQIACQMAVPEPADETVDQGDYGNIINALWPPLGHEKAEDQDGRYDV